MENPFAPPVAQSVDSKTYALQQAGGRKPLAKRSWAMSFAVWSAVCIVSAAPSFVWGYGTVAEKQIGAMVLGVAIFIVLYTAADQWTQNRAWRQPQAARLTLRIGYITRIVISVIFPLGAGIDVICGLFSVGIVQGLFGFLFPSSEFGPMQDAGFALTLLITLVQGIVLNVVLFAYMLIVLGFVVVISNFRQRSQPLDDVHRVHEAEGNFEMELPAIGQEENFGDRNKARDR